MDKSFFSKFPQLFSNALENDELVTFDDIKIEVEFDNLEVYRGIFRDKNTDFSKVEIVEKDFFSYAELGKKYNPRFCSKKICFYSCSVYTDVQNCKSALKFPGDDDRQIAKGIITKDDGSIYRGISNHIDWWIYKQHSEYWKNFKIVL